MASPSVKAKAPPPPLTITRVDSADASISIAKAGEANVTANANKGNGPSTTRPVSAPEPSPATTVSTTGSAYKAPNKSIWDVDPLMARTETPLTGDFSSAMPPFPNTSERTKTGESSTAVATTTRASSTVVESQDLEDQSATSETSSMVPPSLIFSDDTHRSREDGVLDGTTVVGDDDHSAPMTEGGPRRIFNEQGQRMNPFRVELRPPGGNRMLGLRDDTSDQFLTNSDARARGSDNVPSGNAAENPFRIRRDVRGGALGDPSPSRDGMVWARTDVRGRDADRMSSGDGTENPFRVPLVRTPKSEFARALADLDTRADLEAMSIGRTMPKVRAEVDPEEYSFGQRYTKPVNGSVVISNSRTIAPERSDEQECIVCAEVKGPDQFPNTSITTTCKHAPTTCLECVQTAIRIDLNNKLWTEINCPECGEHLEYVDIQKYADERTFSRYEELALRSAMSEATNFIWCTSGCGSGQIHESSTHHPIVTCLHCGHRSCFQHNVTWHENLTCEEYDRLLADPENFKSRLESDAPLDVRRRRQIDADRAVAQGLVAGEQAASRMRRMMRDGREREREQRKRAEKAVEVARRVAARRKREEERSKVTIRNTTKPCPGCGWAIEKNRGCSHMKCIKCAYEFCWGCAVPWYKGHSYKCKGLEEEDEA